MDETDELPWWGWAGAAVALGAVVLELTRVTLTWPRGVRAGWWVLATAGVLGWHLGRAKAGEHVRWPVAGATVAAFAVFTLGVVTAAEWAAWH